MKSTTAFVVGGVFLGLGLFASFYLGFEFGGRTARQEMARRVTVFVATKEIRQGAIITDPEKQFVQKQISRDDAPTNVIGDVRLLQGKQMLRTLDPGAICTWPHVGEYAEFNRGQNAVVGRSGFSILARRTEPRLPEVGSRVDVLSVTLNKDEPALRLPMVVLRNVAVLAVGRLNDTGDKLVVTLALTIAEIRLVLPVAEGVMFEVVSRPKPHDD